MRATLFRVWLMLAAMAPVPAAPVISEVMYHPVEKPAFDAAGDPLFDLTDDIHEFIEIHNPDGTQVALGGWELQRRNQLCLS